MDDSLDWQAAATARSSLQLRRLDAGHFYAPIDPELNVPERQRISPTYMTWTRSAEDRRVNGLDTMFGGWAIVAISHSTKPASP
jgi:hypothetical protein